MEQSNLGRHISGQFNIELHNIRNQVMKMGGLIEQQLTDALMAMSNNDIALANQVIIKDKDVNILESSVDQQCAHIIAKRQPAASDLRLILTTMKSVSELERIGDGVVSLSRMVIDNHGKTGPSLFHIESMGQIVLKMLHNVLDAFTRLDFHAAIIIHSEDKKIKQQYQSIKQELTKFMMENPSNIPLVLKVLSAARSIERISGRCTNICEQIIYLVKGVDVRHATEEEINTLRSI